MTHMTMKELKNAVIKTAVDCAADLVGFAPASRFDKQDPLFAIFPQAKTVICLAFRILRGYLRGIEEGTTYYQYTTMSVENLEEVMMPSGALRVAQLLEEEGFKALPQKRQRLIINDNSDVTNPEMQPGDIVRGLDKEPQLDFIDAAVKCGIGEKSFHGQLLTDDFGPLQRIIFVITDAELEPDPVSEPHLCDNCGECVKACPGHCIDDKGMTDSWRCAVYYKGGAGVKNPFMRPDDFFSEKDRLELIAGEAEITPERARDLLRKIYFYPPIRHSYVTSICGRACDTACYVHLEEQGKLKRSFKQKFRRRPVWKFDISDFDVIGDERK